MSKYVVFTGVRDKELEGVLGQMGWGLQDAVTSKTTVLVVADGEFKESGKTKKAAAAGVKIMKLSEFKTFIRNT
jgi:NAD-dependent DNA ligase